MARMPRMARTPRMARWLADYPDPYYFPENFRCSLKFYEGEDFSDPFLHRIIESKHFSVKNSLGMGALRDDTKNGCVADYN